LILVIDNYDSFTYNLVQYLGELGQEVCVVRNDAIDLKDIEALEPSAILISPGPCAPDQAGISLKTVEQYALRFPILGICLGHQCIGQSFGGKVSSARTIMHGKTSFIYHTGQGIFAGLPSPFEATRYHSLVVEKSSLPDCLELTAWTVNTEGTIDEIMGIRHKKWRVEGVQFHPESILTQQGRALLKNFLDLALR